MGETKTKHIRAFPFVTQDGTIEIPEDLPDGKLKEWVWDHWDEIRFGDPETDYAGTDFEIND